MLTGDKVETAINIGKIYYFRFTRTNSLPTTMFTKTALSCQLVTPEMIQIQVVETRSKSDIPTDSEINRKYWEGVLLKDAKVILSLVNYYKLYYTTL